MSVKFYDKEQGKWVIFPGTMGVPGKDAYIIAQENGYTGTKDEYNQVLTNIPKVVTFIENTDAYPIQDSTNLVKSGGTWQAIEDVKDQVNTLTSNITNQLNEIKITEIPNQIRASIVDSLESSSTDKSLSVNQGRILKEMISNLVSLRLQIVVELPESGEYNIIYLIPNDGAEPNIYDEYVYIDNKWEKIGNTDVDLSNYYTKAEVYNKSEVNDIKSQIESQISDVEINSTGVGNVVTSLEVDTENKHKINVSKTIDVYTKDEVDQKLSDSGLGDVIAVTEFTTENRVIVSNGAGKVIKDSGVLIENLALKSYVDEKKVSWDNVTEKPETYTPSEHKHNVADINDFPEIPKPIQIDSELSSSSENPVQNKVIDTALKNKLDSTALDNYYNKEEVDSKISDAGGGDVIASSTLDSDKLVLGSGNKTIKASSLSVSDITSKLDSVSINTDDENTVVLNQNNNSVTIKGDDVLKTYNNTDEGYPVVYIKHDDNVEHLTKNTITSDQNRVVYVPIGQLNYQVGVLGTDIKYNYNDLENKPTSTLSITAGQQTTEFNPQTSESKTIDLDQIFDAKYLDNWKKTDIPGNEGYYIDLETNSLTVTNIAQSKNSQDAIIIVKGDCQVTFKNTIGNYWWYKHTDVDKISGTENDIKVYCLKTIYYTQSDMLRTSITIINCALYNKIINIL